MLIRRIAWIVFCTCGVILFVFQFMEPVVSSDPGFASILFLMVLWSCSLEL
jgi:hypothetical protein